MTRHRIPKPKECTNCGRAVQNSFICRRCGIELRDLLIGSKDDRGQPGIIWYIRRLRETAYRQSRMTLVGTVADDTNGYTLLADNRAVKLLSQISVSLAVWNADVVALAAPQGRDTSLAAVVVAGRGYGALDEVRARRLAASIPRLRHTTPGIKGLHADMLGYARKAWRIINRPNDICCGPCTAMVKDKQTSADAECRTMLYAEEHAEIVACPKCRTEYDVPTLREKLKQQTHDMLFTGPELLRLMETRLNDKMPKSSFYRLIQDGRLRCRITKLENGREVPYYTYADVVAAREKPEPGWRAKRRALAP